MPKFITARKWYCNYLLRFMISLDSKYSNLSVLIIDLQIMLSGVTKSKILNSIQNQRLNYI